MAEAQEKVVDQVVEGEAAVETNTAKTPPTLELQDLAVTLNLLNAAIKRGAFEPKELAHVGANYEKVEAFLQYQAQLQAAAQAKAAEEEASKAAKVEEAEGEK